MEGRSEEGRDEVVGFLSHRWEAYIGLLPGRREGEQSNKDEQGPRYEGAFISLLR